MNATIVTRNGGIVTMCSGYQCPICSHWYQLQMIRHSSGTYSISSIPFHCSRCHSDMLVQLDDGTWIESGKIVKRWRVRDDVVFVYRDWDVNYACNMIT